MQSLLHAAHLLEKRWEDSLERVGLSGPKFAVLTHLVQAGEPLSLSECAEKMTCVRSNITQLMDRLEADGLVQRIEDPSDRRTVRASVTVLGVKRQAAGALEVEKVQKIDASQPREVNMKNVLLVLSSPRGKQSFSHQFANDVVDELKLRGTHLHVRRKRPCGPA